VTLSTHFLIPVIGLATNNSPLSLVNQLKEKTLPNSIGRNLIKFLWEKNAHTKWPKSNITEGKWIKQEESVRGSKDPCPCCRQSNWDLNLSMSHYNPPPQNM
jgi:hypothetical protein